MKKYFAYAIFLIALIVLFRKMKVSKVKAVSNTAKPNKIKFNKMTVKEFKDFMLPSALMIEKKYGIPHLFTLAQISLETAFGRSELFYKYFNVGGIRSFKPESEPHGYYWTWEHVKPSELPKWDKYERKKSEDAPVIDKNTGKPNGKIKIRVKLPFRHFNSLVDGLSYWVNKVLLNRYFKDYIAEAKGDPLKYVELIQSGRSGAKYATDSNYIPKIHNLINQYKSV